MTIPEDLKQRLMNKDCIKVILSSYTMKVILKATKLSIKIYMLDFYTYKNKR